MTGGRSAKTNRGCVPKMSQPLELAKRLQTRYHQDIRVARPPIGGNRQQNCQQKSNDGVGDSSHRVGTEYP